VITSVVATAIYGLVDSGDGDAGPAVNDRPNSIRLHASLYGTSEHKPDVTLDGITTNLLGTEFRASTHLRRIPCDGRYRFVAFGEAIRSADSTSLSMQMRLHDYQTQPPGAPCGVPLDQRAGQKGGSLRLHGHGQMPIAFTSPRRGRDGLFGGTLQLNALPNCQRLYRLEVTVLNARSARVYLYRVKVTNALVRGQGQVAQTPTPGCRERPRG
jgi:hypothetical protein